MEKGSFQQQYKKALYGAMLVLTWFYLQTGLYRFVMPDYWKVFRIEQWYGLLLAAAALVYLCLAVSRGTESRREIKSRLREFRSYEQIYLIYTFLWYIVSVARYQHVVGGEQFKNNDPWMFATGMMAFLLFPLAQYIGDKDAKRVIERLLKTVLLPFACFTVWLLWQYFHQNYLTFPSGQQLQMEDGAIMRFSNLSHNHLARQAMVMAGLSLYMVITQKPAKKMVYVLTLAVFMVLLILTNSRTSWYITAVMLMCAVFLYCWNKPTIQNVLVKTAAGLLMAVAVGLFCYWVRGEIFVLLDKTLTRQNMTEAAAVQNTAIVSERPNYRLCLLAQEDGNKTKQRTETRTLGLSGYTENSAASNARRYDDNLSTIGNRLPLYQASLKAMFTSRYRFFFGVTPTNVVKLLRNYEEVSETDFEHAHNFFLQMGVSFGVPTMFAAIAFAASLVIRCLRILLFGRNRVFPGAWMLCLMVLCFLANDMMEADLSGGMGIFCVTFYILAGWLLSVDRELCQKRKMEGQS